jgi:hypothetical protein
MPRIGTATKTSRDKAILAALPTLLRGRQADETFAGNTTVGAVRGMLEAHLKAMAKVHELTILRRGAVQEERAIEARLGKVIGSLKRLAEARAGKYSPHMLALGFKPDKKPYMTATAKLVANVKRQATREKRGIIGKKRRKAQGKR